MHLVSVSPDDVFLEPCDESARRLFERAIEGPVTMLNLLRFREVADYSGCSELAPAEPISGRCAYEAYIRHTYLAGIGHRAAALEDSRLLPIVEQPLP